MKTFKPQQIDIDQLIPHPRNYREHPEDQLIHIKQSITDNGFYRNVVVAKDYTILCGHGVVKASRELGLDKVPVIKLDIDPNSSQALKVMTSDNELGRLAEVDDRVLSELLKEISDSDINGLLGTGYDDMMLANLVMITRSAEEIQDINAAAEWLGMPDYEPKPIDKKYIIIFQSAEDRHHFAEIAGLSIGNFDTLTWSTWWPEKEREDPSSVRFVENE